MEKDRVIRFRPKILVRNWVNDLVRVSDRVMARVGVCVKIWDKKRVNFGSVNDQANPH